MASALQIAPLARFALGDSAECCNFVACKAFMTRLTIYDRLLRVDHTPKAPA